MKRVQQDGFVLDESDVINDILIPRYYDPRITEALDALGVDFHVTALSALIAEGHIVHSHGSYVPKIYYGTGPFPYVRTSDIANWEVKASPKHGVPKEVFDDYFVEQQVAPRDILFVHEGTYLIGAVAMITELDGPLLYQHHIAKFTVKDSCPFNPYFLLAALEAPAIHTQVRAKQFSADIIDSVVGRVEELLIPYPKDEQRLRLIEKQVEDAVIGRAKLRQQVAHAVEELDQWLRGASSNTLSEIFSWEPDPKAPREPLFLGGRRGFIASSMQSSEIANDVLLPKYYDPWVEEIAVQYDDRCEIESVGELVEKGLVSLATGDEIGRLNYGTGSIPFVRTSDFGSWELKRESKQGVSKAVYEEWHSRQDVRAGDILLVRDGTYLVGTSILVCDDDLPLLFCGGIYKIRSNDHDALPPGLLFALLNIPFVRRQMKNKQFTRDVIDTIGQRVTELLLPIPTAQNDRSKIGSHFGTALARRTHYRAELSELMRGMFDTSAGAVLGLRDV